MTTSNPIVHCVIGAIGSGKSEYIKTKFPLGRYIVVPPGNVFRMCLGVETMSQDPLPNACVCTEAWANKLAHGGLITAAMLHRDIVFDGYPRSPAQARKLLQTISNVFIGPTSIKIYDVTVDKAVLIERLRAEKNDVERAFDEKRLDASIASCVDVIDSLVTAPRPRGYEIEVLYV